MGVFLSSELTGQISVACSRGYTRQPYLGKCEVSMGKVAFSRVTNFTSGKMFGAAGSG